MTEPETLLRLGIEAAREENKEEARRFFRLLTREDPNNVQGWLWLAGVAENREERQDALEHVLALDPGNEMAQKGLKALGVQPAAAQPAVEPPPPAAAPASTPVDEDDPYGELDNLSDIMAADTAGPVRRSEPPRTDRDESADAGVAATSAAAAEAAARRLGAAPDVARAIAYWEQDRNIPAGLLVALVYVESRFDPQARGSAGEVGLGQVTWQALIDVRRWVDTRYPHDPNRLVEVDYNLWAASGYLALCYRWAVRDLAKGLHDPTLDPWYVALAYYNAGPGDLTRGRAYAERVWSLWRSL